MEVLFISYSVVFALISIICTRLLAGIDCILYLPDRHERDYRNFLLVVIIGCSIVSMVMLGNIIEKNPSTITTVLLVAGIVHSFTFTVTDIFFHKKNHSFTS